MYIVNCVETEKAAGAGDLSIKVHLHVSKKLCQTVPDLAPEAPEAVTLGASFSVQELAQETSGTELDRSVYTSVCSQCKFCQSRAGAKCDRCLFHPFY